MQQKQIFKRKHRNCLLCLFGCGSGLNLTLLHIAGSLLVAAELVGVQTDTAGHGAQIRVVAEQLAHGDVCLDYLFAVVVGVHTKHAAASAVQIAHHVAGELIRNRNL